MSNRIGFVFLGVATVFLGAGNALLTVARADGSIVFDDASSALDFERLPHFLSEGLYGAAWLDYDGDDDLDLFIPGTPGFANALYRNDGKSFTDVADDAGILDGSGGSGAVAADIDNDGFPDLFVTGAGGIGGPDFFAGPNLLFHNMGDGTFEDITDSAGIGEPHPAMMAAFGDIDNDGDLDLFIANPGSFVTGLEPSVLYRNNGDLTFTDISVDAGIAGPDYTPSGACVVNFTDLDGDGWQDILVGNCNNLLFPPEVPEVTPIPGPWELWHNNGDGTFTDLADEAGLNVRPGFPMALTMTDIDNDGDLDAFATGLGIFFSSDPGGDILPEQVLFVNNGDGTFIDGTYTHGLGGFEWGWGASFADFDNDGDDDLFAVGSFPPMFGVVGSPVASPGRLYLNDGTGVMSADQSFDLWDQFTSGLAVADYDANGFPDVFICKTEHDSINLFGQPISGDGHPVLLQNEGNSNHWLTVRLQGTTSNRDGVGAVVRACTEREVVQTKQVFAGTSFASGNSPWLTFGLGLQDDADLQVHWPSGLVEDFGTFAADQMVTLVEGTGIEVVCEGDANGDGTVDPLDAGFVLARFGCPVGTGDPDCDTADMNDDGLVDPLDSGFVLARFGTCE
ncbi:MAG: VCBS repeat-containing protein [Planctomycetes bacterium]|nr:VCBS repeat-containing protein [Planctomycetota bacterium]